MKTFTGKTDSKARLLSLVLILLMTSLACGLLPAETPSPPAQEPTVVVTEIVEPTTAEVPEATPTRTTEPVATQAAEIQVDSQVRRLIPSVFAGPVQPLPELENNRPIGLPAGGLVSTGLGGEAEVVIQGCLKIFVFQDSSLERSTCRRQDVDSGLAVCSTAGLTGVVNNCLAQVDIQTPSGTVQTNGTWFTVLYLPEDELSIVQVYEGEVGVSAIVNTRTGDETSSQPLKEGSVWWTAPGRQAPDIAGISGRQPQPLEIWEAMRPELIERYPQLDMWMEAARQRAEIEDLPFPEYLTQETGQVILTLSGGRWEDLFAREAFFTGFPWLEMNVNTWPFANVATRIEIDNFVIEDARTIEYDPEYAVKTFRERGFIREGVQASVWRPVYIIVEEISRDGTSYAYTLLEKFKEMSIEAEVITVGQESMSYFLDVARDTPNEAYIFISVEVFE